MRSDTIWPPSRVGLEMMSPTIKFERVSIQESSLVPFYFQVQILFPGTVSKNQIVQPIRVRSSKLRKNPTLSTYSTKSTMEEREQ